MRVGDDARHLLDDNDQPFFYLADTGWALFYKTTLEEAEHYLRVRAAQGFTVVMPVLVWDEQGDPGPYDRHAFLDLDPAQPNRSFWERVDQVVAMANEFDLVVALLPTWGHYVSPARRAPQIFRPEDGNAYGRFLGERYHDMEVIWVLGGDRNPKPDQPDYEAFWHTLAAGLDAGDGGRHLMTFHPAAVHSSSEWFHDAAWLDFNMWQTSTNIHIPYCQALLRDYDRAPTKPFLDGETRYEHSHRYFGRRGPSGVRMTPKRVRQAAYYAMLCGALGHTYGCRDAWSFHVPSDVAPWRDVDTYWKDALHFAAAEQLCHWRALFTAYSWHKLVPDRGGHLVTHGNVEGSPHIQGALADDRAFAVIYVPDDMPVWVDLAELAGPAGRRRAVDAQWFDPVTGAYAFIQRFHTKAVTRFYWEANPGEQDHVLVLRAVDVAPTTG